ncbi:MAG: glycosyltransferase family 2 protein [Xanthobacteraceae bacterium]|jgi:glycosyltransferase involved in cell wall biosynthesis
MSPTPLFTVFTATYNRAHTIHRVFGSLRAQTLRDFEWLIVDDGSTDNTAALIADWANEADFPIRYFRQDHSGKHFAHNLAVREARGEFFLPLDSDDACIPEALARLANLWNTIPVSDRVHFSGVGGLCRNQHGEIIGDLFPSEPFDASLRDRRYIYRLRGEKWGMELTDIVRRHPFPEIRGTGFVPEGLVWMEIAKNYKIRSMNEAFRIYYVDDERTIVTLSNQKGLSDNAPGRLHYYAWVLNNDLGYFFYSPKPFLKAAIMLPIVARFAGQRFVDAVKSLHGMPAKLLLFSVLPLSFLLYVSDRFRSLATRRS